MTFLDLHLPGTPFLLMNAWDIGSARVMAALGAEAIGTSSAAFAFTRGLPDGARITREDALGHAAELSRSTALPVSVDYENGYGRDVGEVTESIGQVIRTGAAGCSIEDTAWPSHEPYAFEDAVERVRAAADRCRETDEPFVLVARADGVLTGFYDLDEGIRRVQAFADAGAHCVYIPALPDLAAVERVCGSVNVPVNVLAVGGLRDVTRAQLAEAGVARISVGSSLARVTHRALIDAATSVLDGAFTSFHHGVGAAVVDDLLAAGAVPD